MTTKKTKIRVAQVGCGKRGLRHLSGWVSHPDDFEVVALCELDESRMLPAKEKHHLNCPLYSDVDTMLKDVSPDIFCFATMPDMRLSLVEKAAIHKVPAICFEKPMALSLNEASKILKICQDSGIKATICHQQLFISSFRKLNQILNNGEIGCVSEIHSTSTGNLFDRGTHYTHYLLWASGFAKPRWVTGHIHGRKELKDTHPSPDFCMYRLELDGGITGLGEFGALAPRYDSGDLWQVNRLTVHGSNGKVWAETTGLWGVVTAQNNASVRRGQNDGYLKTDPATGWHWEADKIQNAYAKSISDWLNGVIVDHPCSIEHAYTGFEVLAAACYSSLENVRVDLPLSDPEAITNEGKDIFVRLHDELPECRQIKDVM